MNFDGIEQSKELEFCQDWVFGRERGGNGDYALVGAASEMQLCGAQRFDEPAVDYHIEPRQWLLQFQIRHDFFPSESSVAPDIFV